MIERFLTFLQGLPAHPSRKTLRPEDDPRIAAAALLVHVLEADGTRDAAETARLRKMLSQQYDISGGELDGLLAAGEAADHEAVDLYAFTNTLGRHLDQQGRVDFIRTMWEMVYADGRMDELEDNIVWRVAELIGVENRDRIELRNEVRRKRA